MNKNTVAGIVIALVLLVSSSLSWGADKLAVIRAQGTNALYSAMCPQPCVFTSMAYGASTPTTPTSQFPPVVIGDYITGGWIVFGKEVNNCLFKGTFTSVGTFNRDWQMVGSCINANSNDSIFFADAPIIACTSYSYSVGTCQPGNTAPVTGYTGIPAGCSGGVTPLTSLQCTYVPPPCTSYSYSVGTCQPGNTAPVTGYTGIPAGCSGGVTPLTQQPCNYVTPANPCTDYAYDAWGACQSNNTQTRNVQSGIPSGCTGGVAAVTTQNCIYVPPANTGSATDLGPEGQSNRFSIPANGEQSYFVKLASAASLAQFSLNSTDWTTTQNLIIGKGVQPKCSDRKAQYSIGPTLWYGVSGSTNYTTSVRTTLNVGDILYVTVCNLSKGAGSYEIRWSTQ